MSAARSSVGNAGWPVDDAGGPADEALVQRCVAGEGAAWMSLHAQYYPIAAAFLRKLGTREGDLEDACQEVFLQLFRYLPGFRGEAQLKTWLYRLCASEAKRVRRRGRIKRALLGLLSERRESSLVPAATTSEQAVVEKMRQALDRIGERERLVFVLYEMEGIPGRQVAEIVGCPEATVWRRLHYARKRFRELLDLDGGFGGAA
ncbi:MAG TPA: sigma-70 family RNA polymerase sigma factor [Polyangiaceae bacterium]|nr:sigma-70 family RNA polymerase sigma factor [Polyangiaceae bacterium]